MLKILFFVAKNTLSFVTICVLWCDRPFNMEGIEDISSELLSANMSSMTVIALLSILIAKCTGN
jgi:uncharacterized membrane protein